MTLKGHYAPCFKTRASFGAHHKNLNEDRLYCQRRRCSPLTLDSYNIRFTQIFALVLKIYVNFADFMPAPLYYVIMFNCFVYHSYYLPIWLRRVVKCGLAEMPSALVKCIRRVFGIRRKTADLSQTLRRYVVGILTNKD